MKYLMCLVVLLVVGSVLGETPSPALNTSLADELLQKCIRNNDTIALERARASFNTSIDCVDGMSQSVNALLIQLKRNGTRESMVTSCNLVFDWMDNCTNQMMVDLYPCLQEEDIAAQNLSTAMTMNVLHYLCGEDLLISKLWSRPSDHHCFNEVSEPMGNCLTPLRESVENLTPALDIFRKLTTPSGCRMYRQAGACTAAVFDRCGENVVTQTIQGAINSTLAALPECNEDVDEGNLHVGNRTA